MNRILRFSLLSMLMMFCGASFAQTTVTFDATKDLGPDGSTQGPTQMTKDGITIATTKGMFGNGKEYRCYQNETLTITSSVGNITKVEFTCTANGTTKYGPGCYTVADGTYTYADKTGTWTGDAASVVFTASSAQVRMTSIVVTYGSADPTAVPAPVIEGNTEFEATSDVTITGAEGTTIYYTIDGTDPTTSSTLTGASPLTFTLDKTATVKAIAVKGDKSSIATAKEFTKVEFTDATIASLNELTADKDYVNVSFTDAKVVYVDGTNYFLREGDKAIMFYGSALGFSQNAIVNGSVKVDYVNYRGIHELKDNAFTTEDNLVVTDNSEAAQPVVTTVAELLALNHICDYVMLNGVTITSEVSGKYTNYYANSGSDKIQLYNGLDVSSYAGDGNSYNLTGVFNAIYNEKAEIQPIAVSVATGINNVEANAEKADEVIYNIAGQRLVKAQKGLNIINGKKIIVK